MEEVAEDDSMELNVDKAYEYLSEIFPNADPLYLRNSAEKFESENDIKTFVEDKLESNDYPMREQYLAKIKVTEDQQRYTTNFNVEQFLTLFQDPFTHFEDETRKCKFNLIVQEFLKNEFSRVRVATINAIYRRSKFNMSIAAKSLRLTTDLMLRPRRPREIPTENIQMLQEMAFVRHQRAIREHMEAVQQKEEEEFNLLKAAGDLWTCQCCYDEECIGSKCSTCDNAHVFCNTCVVKGTELKLGDGETRVPCFLNCGSEFSISTLQKVLPLAKFNILLEKRQAEEVMAAGLEGLVACPFCHFALIPPEGDKVFKCLNPKCMKESCIQCKEPNHLPLKCGEQQKKNKARIYIEEKMTQALTHSCYKCKRVFFKEEDCNKMTCVCGAMMCYICNKPVKDYQHFRREGSDEVDKCPLWSDTMRQNAENVRKVEEEARREILRQELAPALPPPIDIDLTRLAPAVPLPLDIDLTRLAPAVPPPLDIDLTGQAPALPPPLDIDLTRLAPALPPPLNIDLTRLAPALPPPLDIDLTRLAPALPPPLDIEPTGLAPAVPPPLDMEPTRLAPALPPPLHIDLTGLAPAIPPPYTINNNIIIL